MKRIFMLFCILFGLLLIAGCNKYDDCHGYLMSKDNIVVDNYKVWFISLTEPYNLVLVSLENEDDVLAFAANTVLFYKKNFTFQYNTKEFGSITINGLATGDDFMTNIANVAAVVTINIKQKEYFGTYSWWEGD
jgi:hypothetical protein